MVYRKLKCSRYVKKIRDISGCNGFFKEIYLILLYKGSVIKNIKNGIIS